MVPPLFFEQILKLLLDDDGVLLVLRLPQLLLPDELL